MLRYEYDTLTRQSKRTITSIDKVKEFSYLAGGYGEMSETALIESVVLEEVTTIYQYDNVGNITEILKNNTLYESYEYDSLNQLIEVTCANGDVYTYTQWNRESYHSYKERRGYKDLWVYRYWLE